MIETNLESNSKSELSPNDEQALFERALAAEGLWRRHADNVWSQIPGGTPEYEQADLESSILSDAYEDLFREFCDFAVEHPSLEVLGKVVVLWRLRCWAGDSMLGLMNDDFEARTIVKLSEILSGIKRH